MAVLGWKQLEVSEKNELPEVAGAGRQGSPQLQAFGVSGEAAAWGLWGSVLLDFVSLSNRGSRCPRAVAGAKHCLNSSTPMQSVAEATDGGADG